MKKIFQITQILISAKEKELDIQTLNMLINKNPNFKEFIDDINKQIKVGKEAKFKLILMKLKAMKKWKNILKKNVFWRNKCLQNA